MIRFTKRIEYSLIAIKHMDSLGRISIVSAKEIAYKYKLPTEVLAKLLQQLVRLGYIKSKQGPKGGYFLNRDKIRAENLVRFIEKIEGPIGIVNCNIDEDCDIIDKCNIQLPMNRINQNIRQYLNNIKIEEIIL